MNAGLVGLLLATLAGLATTLGGAVVFFLHDYRILPFALCMAASAGVITYVSFVEMLPSAVASLIDHFLADGKSQARAADLAYAVATTSFFGGWILTSVVDALVHWILHRFVGSVDPTRIQAEEDIRRKDPERRKTFDRIPSVTAFLQQQTKQETEELQDAAEARPVTPDTAPVNKVNPLLSKDNKAIRSNESLRSAQKSPREPPDVGAFALVDTFVSGSPSFIPGAELTDTVQCMKCADIIPASDAVPVTDASATPPSNSPRKESHSKINIAKQEPGKRTEAPEFNRRSTQNISTTDSFSNPSGIRMFVRKMLLRSETTASDREAIDFAEERFRRQHANFARLGFITAIALALHNFPEGLATFAGTLANPGFGVGIAVAVGIHNIPEGFAVAVPIYFGTGSKWKGFWYSFLSGIAEPVGALIAYFAIGDSVDPLLFGVLFGMIAGIMANIGLKELYPTAVRYDPADKVVTLTFFLSMFLMAMCLVLVKVL